MKTEKKIKVKTEVKNLALLTRKLKKLEKLAEEINQLDLIISVRTQ
jgi:hypothetical protein